MNKKKDEEIEYMLGYKMFLFNKDPGIDLLHEALDTQKISFLLAEGFYNHNMNYAERLRGNPELDRTVDYWKGYEQACLYWFNWCKDFCKEYPPKMRKPTKKEQKEFKYVEELENGEKFEWPLVGIIDYRGNKLPVYDDDNGQCYFCKLPDGRCVSGGGWNPDPEDEFCYEYDEYLNHHEGR